MYFDETLPAAAVKDRSAPPVGSRLPETSAWCAWRFASDPQGHKGLSGSYHVACSKPFASLAHALDATSRFGW
ncbi:MAG: hypothetical protein WDM86_16855 [Rhizomicrobium sp.]